MCLFVSRKERNEIFMKTKKLVVSAVMIGIAAILSVIQPFQLPFGGGITLASMMPVVITAYLYGTKHGLLTAFVFSLIQLVMGAKVVSAFFLPGENQLTVPVAISVCLLDYIFAYTVLGFGGIFRKKIKNSYIEICLGTVFAISLRYLIHIISGTIFFGSWAEWFFTQEGFYRIGKTIINNFSGIGLSLIYSIFYNGLYMIPEIIITATVTPVIYKVIERNRL